MTFLSKFVMIVIALGASSWASAVVLAHSSASGGLFNNGYSAIIYENGVCYRDSSAQAGLTNGGSSRVAVDMSVCAPYLGNASGKTCTPNQRSISNSAGLFNNSYTTITLDENCQCFWNSTVNAGLFNSGHSDSAVDLKVCLNWGLISAEEYNAVTAPRAIVRHRKGHRRP